MTDDIYIFLFQTHDANTRRSRTVFEAGSDNNDVVDGELPTRRSRPNEAKPDQFASPPNVRSATKQPDVPLSQGDDHRRSFTSPNVGTSSKAAGMSSSYQFNSAFLSPSGSSNHSESSNSSKKRKASAMIQSAKEIQSAYKPQSAKTFQRARKLQSAKRLQSAKELQSARELLS